MTASMPPNGKLTRDQVITIYLRLKSDRRRGVVARLSRDNNISQKAVRDIRAKHTWKSLTDTLD